MTTKKINDIMFMSFNHIKISEVCTKNNLYSELYCL